ERKGQAYLPRGKGKRVCRAEDTSCGGHGERGVSGNGTGGASGVYPPLSEIRGPVRQKREGTFGGADMKLILHFLKPYRWLCVFTILAMLLDVAGGLLVPRLTADMINIGVESGSLDYMIGKGIAMLAVTVFS